jgi:ATP-dependent exoDNAse (exonuclease V) beta subunit
MVRREELGLADGPAETLLQGAIDLVFEEKGAWTLVDYKSDTVGDKLDELVAFYTPQIAIYRRYWERLTGSPTRAGLFFAETGQEVWPALPR